MPYPRHHLHALSLCFSIVAASASAQDGKGTLTVGLENDLFGAGDDKHYTHGTEITYVSDTYQPRWLLAVASWFPFYEPTAETRFIWSLGQQIYTPGDIERRDLIVDDRPYAGWLYTSIGLLTDNRDHNHHIDKLELVLGMVGPDSGAENTQNAVHKITDSDEAKGWDNQLDDEFTIDLQYQREWMLPLIEQHVDIVPQVGFSLGTAMRYVGTGAALRVGSGINSDFGPPLMRPSSAGSHYFRPNQSFYWYLFIGAYGRYVEHNIFLDGNRDGDSHSVDKEKWVGDVQAGLVMGWANWRLALTNIIRSREFEGQDEPDEFGSIAISYRF